MVCACREVEDLNILEDTHMLQIYNQLPADRERQTSESVPKRTTATPATI